MTRVGKWYVDYEDLTTCAVAVQARSGTWNMAGRRGENAVVPSRDGSIWSSDKPFDENEFTLEMYAAGAESDGTIPKTTTRAKMVRRHLDRLTRLFGSNQLLTLAFVEDAAVPYGRRNSIPNPSFEAADGVITTRENVLPNPSGELDSRTDAHWSEWATATRRNHALNPDMQVSSADVAMRTNLVVNPRFDTDGVLSVLRTNLIANPSFEVSTSKWAKSGPVAAMQRKVFSATGWPIAGKYSLWIDASGAGTCLAINGPSAVVAGATYTASAYGRNSAGGARDFRVSIQWRNRRGTAISISNGALTSVAAGGVGRPSVTAAAPVGATQAFVRLSYVSTSGADVAYWDSVLLERSATLGDYFDGETDELDGLRHDWVGEPGVGTSREFVEAPSGWRSDRTLAATVTNKMVGNQAAKVTVGTTAAAGVLLLGQTVAAGSNVGISKVAAGLIHAFTPAAGFDVAVRLACYDAGRNYLGPLKDLSTGVNLADVVSSIEEAAWTAIEYGGGTVQTGTDRVVLEVYTSGTAWVAGTAAYFDQAMVEPTRAAGNWFDGSALPTEEFDFAWTGTPHNSASQQRGGSLDLWTATNAFQYRASSGYLGDYCLRAEAPPAPIAAISTVGVLGGPVVVGDVLTASAYVRPSRDMSLRVKVGASVGTTVLCTAGVWTRLSGTFTSNGLTVGVEQAFAATEGDYFDVDAVLVERSSALGAYFDGGSGDLYAWDGLEGITPSVAILPQATGWSRWGDTAQPAVGRSVERFAAGTSSVKAIAAYAGDFGVTTGRDSTVVGRTHSFGIDVSLVTSRTVRTGIRWYNAAGALVSEDFVDTAVTAGAGFTRASVTAVAPAGVVVASPYAAVLAGVAGEVAYFDRGYFGTGSDASYADGSTASWVWTGPVNNSVSRLTAPRVDNWRPSSAVQLTRSSTSPAVLNRAPDPSLEGAAGTTTSATLYPISDDTAIFYAGTKSKRVDRAATTPSAIIGTFHLTGTSTSSPVKVPVTPGEIVSASFRGRNGVAGGRFTLNLRWYDSTGATITTTSDSLVAVTQNTWTEIKRENQTVPAGASHVSVLATAYGPSGYTSVGGEQAWFDAVMVNSGSTVLPYFDGTTPADATYTYGWAGTANASTPTRTEKVVWRGKGTYVGHAEMLNSTGPHYVEALAGEDPGDVAASYFAYDPEKSVTAAADIRGVEAGEVRVVIVPFTWDGWTMSPSTDAAITGAKVPYAIEQVVRPQISGSFTSATTHYLVRIEFFAIGGGTAIAGRRARIDRAISGLGSWDGSYFDGDDATAGWEGGASTSASRFFGDARVIRCEAKDAIDFSDIGGGTTAKFAVRLKAPEVFFRDQALLRTTLAVGRSGTVHTLFALQGGTARIADSVWRLNGPFTNLKLTDIGSGAWVAIDLAVPAGDWVELDNGEWTVKRKSGASVITDVRHGGSSTLLPITPLSVSSAPRVRIEAGSVGDGAWLQLTAQRRFHLA